MGAILDLTDGEWELVADLFDPAGRRGAPEVYPRRMIVRRCSGWPGPGSSGAICPSGSRIMEVAAMGYLFARLRVEPA